MNYHRPNSKVLNVLTQLKLIVKISSFAFCLAIVISCMISTIQAAIVGSGDVYPLDPNTWTLSNDGTIGQSTSGTVTVDGGSILKCRIGYLGYDYGSTGTALITGTGSKWTNSNSLYVGKSGNGSLNIEAGGLVSNTIGYIGFDFGSIGTVIVTGTGSKWTSSSGLYIGQSGNGTLIIRAGGQVSNTDSYLGYNLNSTGNVTVTGVGSNWINNNLFVGRSGGGSVTVADGGVVTVNAGLFASLNSLLGNGTISTKGAVLDANLTFDATHGLAQTLTFGTSGQLNLNQNASAALGAGYKGDGTLRIAEGKIVASSIGYIGYQPGSVGISTVTDTGSKWINSKDLYVGNSGSGVLNIEAGGQVSNTTGYLGYQAGSAGTANVTGLSSIWTNSSDFIAGYSGNGILNIQSSGQVSNANGYIGYFSGSIGAVTLSGTGSLWTSSSGLYIGQSGSGTLHIGTGGKVNNTVGNIGNNSGSVGVVTVTGTGSKWNCSDNLNVGFSGDGTMNIEAGGQVTNTTCNIGAQIGSTGKVIVTGNGSTWVNQATFMVGMAGNGNLIIEDGGRVSNSTQGGLGDSIGYSAGSTGIVTVTGIGSQWTNSVRVYVGNSGNGTLSIEDGGQVTNTLGFIGYNAGSTGSVTVKGIGSTWTNSDSLYVDYNGSGTLTIKDGGVVNSLTLYAPLDALQGNGTISTNGAVLDTDIVFDNIHGLQQTFVFGSGGTLKLDLNGKGALGAGYRGTGTLRICDGLAITSASGVLGCVSNSNGTAVVTGIGSSWINTGNLSVGSSGTGTLRIEASGQVSNIEGSVNSAGTVTVTGIGSKWSNSGNLYVGRYDYGMLNIDSGGVVSNIQGFVGYQTVSSSDFTSVVTVTGPGSMWINNSNLYIGYSAKGAMTIEAGGVVNSSTSFIGNSSGGTALITGDGSIWNVSRDLYIGNNFSCSGTLRIEAGGQLSSTWAYLGYASNASGVVTVHGVGSKWTNTSSMFIGRTGRGTLNIEAGGQVINEYDCYMGYLPNGIGSSGTATVTGNGSAWINKTGICVGYRGKGTLNVIDGGLVTATSLTLADGSASTAVCNIDGGTVMTGVIKAGTGSVSFNWNDGIIQNYNSDTDLSISSNLNLKLGATGTHTFNIDLGRTGIIDAFLSDATSGGTLTKTGMGLLKLTGANAYSGDTYIDGGILSIQNPYLNDLASVHISSTAILDLNFVGNDVVGALYLDGLPADVGTWGSSLSAANHIDNVHFSGRGMLNVVPEPATIALLSMAGIAFMACVWRRSRNAR